MTTRAFLGAAALVISSFTPITFPLFASAASAAAPALDACGLNQLQRNHGWRCIASDDVVRSESGLAGGAMCIDRDVTAGGYTGLNPAGKVDADHSSTGGAETYGPWGTPYPAYGGDTCNYLLVWTAPPPPPPPPPAP